MTYGQIEPATKSKNMLDKFVDAYRNYMNYNNPQLQANKSLEKDGASVFDGYFGGSNSILGSPFYGDMPYPFVTLDVTNPQLYEELHRQNLINSQVGLEDFYKSRNINSKPLIRGRVR